MLCVDVTLVGIYDLIVVATYEGYTTPEATMPFSLELIDLCLAPTLTNPGQATVPDYYYVGTATFTLAQFTIDPAECAVTYSCTKPYGNPNSCDDSPSATLVTSWTGGNTFTLEVYDMSELEPN